MITREWKDIFLSNGVRSSVPITSAKERFNLNNPGGRIIGRDFFERFGEKFEAIEVNEIGKIIVWTATKVWCIRMHRNLEQMMFLPRNPEMADDYNVVQMITENWKDFIVRPGGPIPNLSERFNLESEGDMMRRDFFEKFGEKFETMEIHRGGGIILWTTNKVWCTSREGEREKLIDLPRNPKFADEGIKASE